MPDGDGIWAKSCNIRKYRLEEPQAAGATTVLSTRGPGGGKENGLPALTAGPRTPMRGNAVWGQDWGMLFYLFFFSGKQHGRCHVTLRKRARLVILRHC